MVVHTTIIFQTSWHFASASGLKFSHDDHNNDNDWIFNISEIKTKQYNDQSYLVCVEHGFIVNKTHTSFKKTVHKKIRSESVILHISIFQME